MKLRRLFWVLLVTETSVACARSEPPGVRSGAEATVRPVAATTPSIPQSRAPEAHAHSAPSTVANDGGTDVQHSLAVNSKTDNDSLLDSEGQPKPQTNDKPSIEDERFQARVSTLCKSILNGTPETAHDAFFPVVAYRQVKAIEDPDRDYRLRLLRHFDRDILDYHRRVTRRVGPIQCSGLKVSEAQARWMKPGSEYNRVGYFRVLRSQLGFTDGAGNTFSLEVTSLISWRGQWYVVHLNGFE